MTNWEWTHDPLSAKPPPWRYEDDKTAQRADAMFDLVVDEETDRVLGYWYEDVAQRFGWDFKKWMRGQTVALIDGKSVVYRHDVWQYMDGGRPLD